MQFKFTNLNFKRVPRRARILTSIFGVICVVLVATIVAGIFPVFGAVKTWDGGGADNNWSTCANWNADTCPAAADTVTFDGTSSKNVTVDAGFAGTIATVNINTGYTGTITLARSFTVSTSFSQAGTSSTFDGSNQTMSTVTFSLTGGTFTSTSGNFTVTSTFTISGTPTFNANGGTVTFSGNTATASCNNVTFNLVVISKSSGSGFTANTGCNFPLGNNPTITSPNGGTLSFGGTVSGSGTITFTSGTATVFALTAGGSLSGFSGLIVPGLSVTGTTLDMTSYTTFSLAGQLVVSSGTLKLPAATGTLNVTTLNITGTSTFTASPSNMNVDSTFNITGTTTFNANGGTVTFSGGTATATCNNVIFNSVVVAKTSGTGLTTNTGCNFPLGNNPTITSPNGGTLSFGGTLSGSGTITFSSGTATVFALTAGGSLSGFSGLVVPGLSVTGTTLDLSAYTTFSEAGLLVVSSGTLKLPLATGTLNVTTLNITGTSTFVASPSNMNVDSTFNITGTTTFNANGGTVTFSGGTATATCNNVTFNSVVISKTSGSGFTANTGCNFPLGNNPTLGVPNGGTLSFGGTLSGTGLITMNSLSSNLFALTAGGVVSGFTGFTGPGISVTGTSWDMTSYTTFSENGPIAVVGGTLKLPAATGTLTVSTFTISGTSTFTASPSNMSVSSTFSITGTTTFNANGGTITFNGSGATITCNSVTFNSVVFSKNSGSDTTISNGCNFPLGNNPTITTATSGNIILNGNLSGSGTLSYSGGATQIQIGSTGSITGFTGLLTAGLAVTGTTYDMSSYTVFGSAGAVNVNTGATLSLPNNNEIDGTLTLAGGTFNAPSGTLLLKGALTVTGSPTFNANGGTVDFAGGTATLSCGNISFSKVSFTGQTGTKTVNSNCSLPLGADPTIPNSITLSGTLSGTNGLSFTTGTVTLNSGAAVTGFNAIAFPAVSVAGATLNFSSITGFFGVGGPLSIGSGSITLPNGATMFSTLALSGGTLGSTTGDITVNGNITMSSGTLNAPSGTFNVGAALTLSGGTFNNNGGTVNFTGSGVTLSCNNVAFNRVAFGNTGTITVNSNCSMPLGSNPTIANGITLNGTLSGSGTATMTTGTLTLNSGYSISGFSGLALSTFVMSNSAGAANFGGLTTFSVAGTTNINLSDTLTVPPGSSFTGLVTISGTASALTATTGDVTMAGGVSLTTGTLTAPSGNLYIGGNFAHVSGTFTHNSGTVVFNGTSQTISGIATTFNNLTKVLTSASAATLTFPAGVVTTVTGILTLNGYDSSSRLSLRSSNNGSQWRIDPQGTRSVLYLDVKDGNNISATPVQMGGTGSQDSTNNTNFNFGSLTPNDPTSLGPSGVISNVYVLNLKPLFSFSLSDPNTLDTVKFQIQIDDTSDFSSPVVDYTSALASQGSKSFTVGQSAGSGTYAVGSSGQSLTTGSYYWRVKNYDNNGLNSSFTTANSGSVAFLIDSTPPDSFTPTLNVTSPTSNARPTVSFSTTDNVAVDHYQVKVDSGSFSTQTSPYQIPTQANGAHTITVRAYDTTGNTTDGTVSVTINTSPPDAFTPTLNITSPSNNQTPQLSFSTTDDVGVDHYEVKVDGGTFSTQTSPYSVPTLSNGSHTITVRAFDTSGNTTDGSVSITIDVVAPNSFTPTLNVTSPTTNQTPQVSFSTTDLNGINHYEVDIDGGGFTTQTSPYTTPTLSIGAHTITVKAFDNAGNTRNGSVNVTVSASDSTPPVAFTPTLNTGAYTNNQTPQVSFSTTDNIGIDHYEVDVDSGGFSTQTSPYTLPTLSAGAHTITVRAFDTSNNTRDGSVSVTIDLTSPNAFTPVFITTSPTNDSTPRISFSTTDNIGIDHYQVSVDGGGYSTHSSPYDLPALTTGNHTATVKAFDAAGNSTISSTVSIDVDLVLPATFTPTLNVTSPTTNTQPTVTFSTTDNVAIDHYQVKVDTGSFSTQSSPYQLPVLADGAHTITVRAFDTAGNTRDGTVNVTVDVQGPDAFTPTLDVTSPSNNTQPTVTFSTTDNEGIDHYEVKADGGSFTTQSSPYQLPVLTDGNRTITVRAFDTTGNYTDGTVNIIIDTTAPVINSNVPKTASNVDITNTTFSFNDTVGINKDNISVTGAVAHCVQSSALLVSCTTVISASGTLHVSGTDNAGNTSAADISDYVIETEAPVITITAPTKSSAHTITDTTITVTDNYAIDAADVVAISGGAISCSQTSDTQVDCTATVSASGDLVINANDVAGNAGSDTESGYTVSTTAPNSFTPTLNTGSGFTNNTTPILFFSTTDSDGIDHYEVKIDSGSFVTQTSPYQLPTLSAGFHTFTVRAFDELTNFTDGTTSVTIDITAPAAFTPTLNVISPTNNNQPIVSYSTTDANGINHYEVKVDSGSFLTRSSPYNIPTLVDGGHTITVRAFDNAGNTTDGTVNVEVDTSVPANFTPTLNVTSPTNDQTPTVTFSTTDNVAIDHYELKVDGGSFTSRTSPAVLSTLAEGDHTITVRAFDTAGNTRDGSVNLTVDITSPADFTPTLNVSSPTTDITPQVTFSTTDNVAIDHYEVDIDGDGFVTQTSPYTVPALSNGDHTITVRAFDTAGNTKDGSVDITVELNGPADFTPVLSVTSPTNNQTPTLSFVTFSDVAMDHYEVQIDGGSFTTQTSPYALPTLAEGDHTFVVRAFDASNNTADGSVNLTVDITAPADFTPLLNVTSPTNNQTPTLSFHTTDNLAVDHYTVQIDSGSITTQTSPYVLPTLANGGHMIEVVAYDTAGNSKSGSVSLTVDVNTAVIVISAPTKVSTTTITDTTVVVTDDIGILVANVNAVGGTIVCTQASATEVDCTASISVSGDLIINTTDNAGNDVSNAELGYEISSSAPAAFTPTLNTGSVTSNVHPIVSFSTTDTDGINHYEVQIDGGSFSTQSSPYQLPDLSEGFHTVLVRAFSNNGNFRDGSVSVTIDLTNPINLSLVLNVTSPTNDPRPIVSFGASDSVGIDHYEVKVASEGGEFTAQTSPYQVPELDEEEHTITVRAFDKAGNFVEAAVNLLEDRTPPTGEFIINNQAAETADRRVNLSLNAHDDAAGVNQMIISENSDFKNASYQSYATSDDFQLSENLGTKTLYVKFKDAAGNESEVYQASIDYVPASQLAEGTGIFGGIFNTLIVQQTLQFAKESIPSVLVVGAVANVVSAIVAYPRVLMYGIFVVRFKKRKKSLGIIYDAKTKKPVPFASVRLYLNGTVIAQRVTDLDGKYGIAASPGVYSIEIQHPEYQSYKQQIILKEEEAVALDVALTKSVINTGNWRERLKKNLPLFNKVLVYVGFVFSIIVLLLDATWVNLLIVLLYITQFIILFFLNHRTRRDWGYVYDSKTNQGLKGVFVRIYDPVKSTQLDVAITDGQGRYAFKLADGKYLITAYAEGFNFPSARQPKRNLLVSPAGQTFVEVEVRNGRPINQVLLLDSVSH